MQRDMINEQITTKFKVCKHSMLILYSPLLRGNTKGTALGLGGKCCVPRWKAWQIAFIFDDTIYIHGIIVRTWQVLWI